ncbi:MATE family efflux transporter, partial [[Eubacterium] siraeum]|nr:MATE family efflux transporter [[Eubacterium] siraeum]
SVIAGNFVSDKALGAIGASYPVTMIFMAVATGGSVGASVVVARLFGSKDYTYMKTAVNTTLVSFAVIAALLTVIGCVLCSPMLYLLGTPDDIFADS